jgi:hypothetical protein
VNLGNPVELTMLEFAERIRRLMQSDLKVVHHPLPEDDPRKRRPDISKAETRAGLGTESFARRRTALDRRVFQRSECPRRRLNPESRVLEERRRPTRREPRRCIPFEC